MPKLQTPPTPPQPISDLRKLQLARLERNSNADYQRVLDTLSPADRGLVLHYVDNLAGKPLPPLPAPGKPHILVRK